MNRCFKVLAVALVLSWTGLSGARAGDIITGIALSDARAALVAAGMEDITEHTVDPAYPSVGGIGSDGFNIQITLHHCRESDGKCGGVEFGAYLPSTSVANAQIIEGSILRSVKGLDAQVLPNVGDVPAVVQISTFILLDYGASEELIPVTLGFLLSVVGKTKGFMLSDDPGHAELWQHAD